MKILALFALIPLAIGPLPQDEPRITAALCNGGTITIPLRKKQPEPPRDCHQKACHSVSCREKTKRPSR